MGRNQISFQDLYSALTFEPLPPCWERQHPLLKAREDRSWSCLCYHLSVKVCLRLGVKPNPGDCLLCGNAHQHPGKSGVCGGQGRNFNLHYPFARVQKCGSHAHGWGQQLLLRCWHRGCQEHHPSPSHICLVFFHHKTRKDNSESCLYCALSVLAGKKL